MIDIIKKGNTALTVIGAAVTAYQLMIQTFKWYEKKHKKKKKKAEPLVRPIIKGQ